MLSEQQVKEKLNKGWIKSRLWFDVLAVSQEATEKAMKEHIEKLRKQKNTEIIAEKFSSVMEVENPVKNVKKGYSQAVKTEVLTDNIETLLYNVVFFAPSAIEILDPLQIKLGANSIQVIMNSVADLIHRYSITHGVGGVVIGTRK